MGIFDWLRKKKKIKRENFDTQGIDMFGDEYQNVKFGGPGTCRHCGKEVGNLAYHEARCHTEQIEDNMAAMEAALRVLQERSDARKRETARSIRG